ncbi:MAG: hypothetical protein KAH24_01905 [Holophagae bacterium]|nr:hypothetical protein [Holophagae bacterium]
MEPTRRIEKIRQALQKHYGPLNWWPGDGPDEIAIGAVLTQNTGWNNAERAIGQMKAVGLISFPAILSADISRLSEIIRPSGYFNQKAKKLKALANAVCRNGNGTIVQFLSGKTTDEARTLLLNIWGIGMETADSILLYAGERLIFVVDAYTIRIFSRHELVASNADYETVRNMVESAIPPDTAGYNAFHAGLVHLGKDFCHRRIPDCSHCPLSSQNTLCRETGKSYDH